MGKKNPNYTTHLSLPLFLPSSVRVLSVPAHTCLTFRVNQATPARVPTRVLGNVPPSEQRTDTRDLLCPLGQFPWIGGTNGGLIQGFINLIVDCNRNLSYIGTVSENRLRRRGKRQWVTATLLLPASLPSAEAQKNGSARADLVPSSRLIKLHVGKGKAKLRRCAR